jgi:hypothetical protein
MTQDIFISALLLGLKNWVNSGVEAFASLNDSLSLSELRPCAAWGGEEGRAWDRRGREGARGEGDRGGSAEKGGVK